MNPDLFAFAGYSESFSHVPSSSFNRNYPSKVAGAFSCVCLAALIYLSVYLDGF